MTALVKLHGRGYGVHLDWCAHRPCDVLAAPVDHRRVHDRLSRLVCLGPGFGYRRLRARAAYVTAKCSAKALFRVDPRGRSRITPHAVPGILGQTSEFSVRNVIPAQSPPEGGEVIPRVRLAARS